jgi:D-3-phosphoglycerate dehydrogenase
VAATRTPSPTFTVGMMLAECRNIARAHHAIKTGNCARPSSTATPSRKRRQSDRPGRFGNIGSLVAKNCPGFEVSVLFYDPYAKPGGHQGRRRRTRQPGRALQHVRFRLHPRRLTDANKKMINAHLLGLMKRRLFHQIPAVPAWLTRTHWRGLAEKRIMGAALDVFTTEQSIRTARS